MTIARTGTAAPRREGAVVGEPNPVGPLSLLSPPGASVEHGEAADTSVLGDLRLDQVIAELTRKAVDPESLRRLFSTPLTGVAAVRYRQQVFADMEDPAVLRGVRSFAEGMNRVRRRLAAAANAEDRHIGNALILDAAGSYAETLRGLEGTLDDAALASAALRRLRRFLHAYLTSPEFGALLADACAARARLEAIRYCVWVRGLRVEVSRYEGEPDYSTEAAAAFARFDHGAARRYDVRYRAEPALGHVGAAILALVARLFPDAFATLERFADAHADPVDPVFEQARQELPFYLSCIDLMASLGAAGLDHCLPDVQVGQRAGSGEEASGMYDLALALKLVRERRPIVLNDLVVAPGERVVVVSGPNQGGKTTFARAVGQMHHLASLGCPVPGSAARLVLPDRIFTHFTREEDRSGTGGRLEDDLTRAGRILESASAASLVVMNEPFSSTALEDARFLGRMAIQTIVDLGATCVYVTFVDELSRLGPSVASMVSRVLGEDPSQRTFKVVRAPADGLAYAIALAEREGVTYDQLRGRIR